MAEKPEASLRPYRISNKFTVEKLMSMLDKEKLEAIKGEFERHPEGLALQKFVWFLLQLLSRTLKCAMDYEEADKIDLVHGLCKLFSEIDVSEEKSMRWKEFTQYIIDAVMQDSAKNTHNGELPNQKEMIAQAHSKEYTRFSLSSYTDSVVHEGLIQKVEFYPSLNKLLLLEQQSNTIKFVTPELKAKQTLSLADEEGVKDAKSFVTSFAFDEANGVVWFG